MLHRRRFLVRAFPIAQLGRRNGGIEETLTLVESNDVGKPIASSRATSFALSSIGGGGGGGGGGISISSSVLVDGGGGGGGGGGNSSIGCPVVEESGEEEEAGVGTSTGDFWCCIKDSSFFVTLGFFSSSNGRWLVDPSDNNSFSFLLDGTRFMSNPPPTKKHNVHV